MATGISSINKALSQIPKRAESRQAEQLRDTFVDSGVSAALETVDHQIVFGRRGTGKTHALRYLESVVQSGGDIGVYVDLRTVGSPESLFMGAPIPPTERAARLLVDLLTQFHEALMGAALENDDLITDQSFVRRLDGFLASVSAVRISGDVEIEEQDEDSSKRSQTAKGSAKVSKTPSVEIGGSIGTESSARKSVREKRSGRESFAMNFSDITRSLRALAETLSGHRVWLIIDEWSSVPADIQPYVGEFLLRCVLPLQPFTVKIAAIEQQTNFRAEVDGVGLIGIEVGADITANLSLDEFMVFEHNEQRARDFFRGLFFKHMQLDSDGDIELGLLEERDVIRHGFTEIRAFDELVRAAEGVPRDALNIAGKAAFRAADRKVSVPDIRTAAQLWYQTDKAAALRSKSEASSLLNWIIDRVIRGRRARGFLVNQNDVDSPLLNALFDARVLHVVRKGYSSQAEPGERYDVYVIDYGAYVDQIATKYAPQGLLPFNEDEYIDDIDVPVQDLRAIRRAVLDLTEYAFSAKSMTNER